MTWMDYTFLAFTVILVIWWWHIARKWQEIANTWREKYEEAIDVGEQIQKIAEDKQKEYDFLKKICNVWQVMAPMSLQEAICTKQDATQYLSKLDQVMGFATDSEMIKVLDDESQNNIAAAVVKMDQTREEVETFLDSLQD